MFVAHLQIDSQVPDATFQTVLYPVPPPKSLAAENGKGRLQPLKELTKGLKLFSM